MIKEQQQQQFIAQEQRAWREDLMKDQQSQKERQELCESRQRKWQEEFAQMQLQQHQQVMTEYHGLMQAQTKEKLSCHEHLVQRLGQLKWTQEQQLVRRQAELKEDIAGLKDRIDMAQSEEEQWFADLREQALAVDSCMKEYVGVAREEL